MCPFLHFNLKIHTHITGKKRKIILHAQVTKRILFIQIYSGENSIFQPGKAFPNNETETHYASLQNFMEQKFLKWNIREIFYSLVVFTLSSRQFLDPSSAHLALPWKAERKS